MVASTAADHGVQISNDAAQSWIRPLVVPVPLRPGAVKRIGRLPYGDHPRQRLDVYRHRNGDLFGPILVYFHGGGYSSGSNRNEGRVLLHRLAVQGWTCISATYRLRPDAGFTDHLDDARTVLRWARDNSEIHGGDVTRIVMAGSSAGAHMTATTALAPPSSAEAVPRIAAAVCLYPWIGRYFGRGEDESQPSTPLALDPSTAPPILIAHGDHDSWVPVEEARALYDHIRTGSPNTTGRSSCPAPNTPSMLCSPGAMPPSWTASSPSWNHRRCQ